MIELANHHPRVNILQPGPGVGGHCIAVDPWFIVAAAPEESKLIRHAREINDAKPQWVVDKVKAAAYGLERPTIALLGLAFKPNIDDLRESPALAIAEQLTDEMPDAQFVTIEPHIQTLPSRLSGKPNVCLLDADEGLERADVVVALVDHQVFKAIPYDRVADKKIVDTKGLWRLP